MKNTMKVEKAAMLVVFDRCQNEIQNLKVVIGKFVQWFRLLLIYKYIFDYYNCYSNWIHREDIEFRFNEFK